MWAVERNDGISTDDWNMVGLFASHKEASDRLWEFQQPSTLRYRIVPATEDHLGDCGKIVAVLNHQ